MSNKSNLSPGVLSADVGKSDMPNRAAAPYPFVSVIMAVRNEAAFIERSLSAVLAQDYPADRMEVLVADGCSEDSTRQIIRNLETDYPNLHLIDNPGRIVSTGLNAALRESSGAIIVRVDGHTIIARDYVRTCVSTLENSDASTVGGRMDSTATSQFGNAVALATSSPFGVGGSRFHFSNEIEYVDTVYLGAWKREVFQNVGLFDEELIRDQDDEFNYRIRSQNGAVLLNPAIKSVYYNRTSLRSLWRQYRQYGYWKVRVFQKHPGQMQPRHFVPGLFVLSLILLTLTSPFFAAARWALGLEVAFYMLANLTASVLTAKGEGFPLLALLPVIYGSLHLSYGVGFLMGLVRFADRWLIRRYQPEAALLEQAGGNRF